MGQVQLTGLDRLRYHEKVIRADEIDGKSHETVDPDETVPAQAESSPRISRATSLSSLTNDVNKVRRNENFIISRLFKEATAISSGSISESSFDEKYTLDHPPELRPNSLAEETGWPSAASTRTPAEGKVNFNMQISDKNGNGLVSAGYLHELTRGPDDVFSVSAKSGKSGKSSKFSTGFLTYVNDKYQYSSRRKKLLVCFFLCIFLFLAVVSGVMTVMSLTGSFRASNPDTIEAGGPAVVQHMPQNELGPFRDVTIDATLANNNPKNDYNTGNDADIPTVMPVKNDVWSGDKYEINTAENTTKIKITSSTSPTIAPSSSSPSEFQNDGGLFDLPSPTRMHVSLDPSPRPATKYPSGEFTDAPVTSHPIYNPSREATVAPATPRPSYAPT